MTTIPGAQNVATFLGGGFSNPQFAAPQIPGTGSLPQLQPAPIDQQVQQNNAQQLGSPQSNSFNALLLNQLSSGLSNSNVNHSYGGGGVKPNYFGAPSQPNATQKSPMMNGMFGQ